jgi:hypothetical protein
MKPRRFIEKQLSALGCQQIVADYISPAKSVDATHTWVVHCTYGGHRCTFEECHDTSQLAANDLVTLVEEDIESGFIFDREHYCDP